MAKGFTIPVTVVLDRADLSPLDLTPIIEPGSLTWSSVVPGGFASCNFQVNGDFRRILKLLPFLSIVRVIGDSGRVLFEGQIEDLQPTLSQDTIGVVVGAFGLQNLLKESTVGQRVWAKRDLNWDTSLLAPGVVRGPYTVSPNLGVTTGNYDPTNFAHSGIQVVPTAAGVSLANNQGAFAQVVLPVGMTQLVRLRGLMDAAGTDVGSTKYEASWLQLSAGAWSQITSSVATGTGLSTTATVNASATALAWGAVNTSGAAVALAANDSLSLYDIRLIGVVNDEDVVDSFAAGNISFGGFYGSTLINSLLTFVANLQPGVIEPGTDFTIDHLDASVRRTAYDILQEIASYYTREWAVWENATLNWTTPNLQQAQWILPLSALTTLDLDASVTNAFVATYVLYTDAASGVDSAAAKVSADRRNPYVLKGRNKDLLTTPGLAMTSNTAGQLAAALLQNIGYGPVPSSGTLSLPGETIVQHASGNAAKAWEIRAGDNVTLPELPMTDIFTQDGRGEVLFHVVSAEATPDSGGVVTLTLDSYGSKRSDILLARLAAVTQLLGG